MKIPPIAIKIDGKILNQFTVISLSINYPINGIPSANVTLGISGESSHIFDAKAQSELASCRPNHELIVQIKKSVAFKGIIVQQTLRLKGQDSLMILTAKHPLQKLTHSFHSQLFSQQSDEAIIKKLFSQAGVSVTIKQAPQLKMAHEQMVQFRCNDWTFLKSRLSATNTWLIPGHDAVTLVTPESLNRSTVHTIRQRGDLRDIVLFEANLQWDNQRSPKTVSVQSWDINQQKLSQAVQAKHSGFGGGQLATDTLKSLTDQEWQWIFSYPLDNEQTRQFTQSIMGNRRSHNISGSFEVAGDDRYQPSDVLALTGFGQGMDGQAIITGVSQTINQRQGWRTRLMLGMQSDVEQSVPPIKELHIGIVEKYQQDSQSLGRIPVKIAALNLTNGTLFARLGKPYASHESGFCFYPEPGDEVIIGFFECDPRFPVILGAMHNPKNRSPLEPSEKNLVKTLVIKQGENQQALIFDNKDNTLAFNSGKNTLSLQQGNGIVVDTDKIYVKPNNGITVDGKGVSVKAGNGISVGEKGVEVKAKDKGSISVDSDGIAVKCWDGGGIVVTDNAGLYLKLEGGNTNNAWSGVSGLSLSKNGVKVKAGNGIKVDDKGVSIDPNKVLPSVLLNQPKLRVVCLMEPGDALVWIKYLPMVQINMPIATLVDKKTILEENLPDDAAQRINTVQLCQRFSFTAETLPLILKEAYQYQILRQPDGQLEEIDLRKALNFRAQQSLGKLARRITPKRNFNDLVISDELVQQLKEIIAAINYRDQILDAGFQQKIGYGTGISALFYGESGTGKTMAAEVIAGHLGVDLIKVDLSTVVNKYIGETEKNIARIFDLAEIDSGVLFFDEADALFGKRSETKNAQDRHANIEVSYLLQRLEDYPGLVILATNNRNHLDSAFNRRFTFITHFTYPDETLRKKMWQTIWPQQLKLSDEIDFAHLAKRADLTGANIRNIALLASILAADNNSEKIENQHIERAVILELNKSGRVIF
ncbi:AAA family ATPase [Photorhabdus caribbeanensis]|uniref:AAA family ATPase n=1 Tax=Photorhabdus caribbeanensis TaxID=1004165 RepID=UPI001FE3D319|nr:AAA family ATPase [Photorhabdus caribbeanensis]